MPRAVVAENGAFHDSRAIFRRRRADLPAECSSDECANCAMNAVYAGACGFASNMGREQATSSMHSFGFLGCRPRIALTLADRIFLPFNLTFEVGAGFDRYRLVNDISLNPRG